MSEHPLGVPTWTAVTCACALAIGLGAWGIAGNTTAKPAAKTAVAISSPTPTPSASPTQTDSESPTPSSSPTPHLTSDYARSVLLSSADSTKALEIDSPSISKVSTAKALSQLTGGSPSSFLVDNKQCLPLLLAGGSVWKTSADPAPTDSVYMMQDDTDSDNQTDLTVSQSSRQFSTQAAIKSYVSGLHDGMDNCDEVIIQTSKDSDPVSQSVYPIDVKGSKYLVTAYILGVDGFTDGTAQAVLQRGNLSTTVTVSTSSASHKRLAKALAAAVSHIDARMARL